MNSLKVIRSKKILSLALLFFLFEELLCFILIMNSDIKTLNSLSIFFVISLICYLITSNYFFYFEYDKRKVEVKNSWNFFLSKSFDIEEIDKVEMGFVAFSGTTVVFTIKGKRYGYPIGSIQESDIKKMISNIEELKESELIIQ